MRTRVLAACVLPLLLLVLGCNLLSSAPKTSQNQPGNGGDVFPGGDLDGGPPGGGGGGDGGGGGNDGGGGGGGNQGGGCEPGVADFFVAPNGNDNWSGTLDTPNGSDGPFATVDRARRAVQAMPGGKHTVMLRGGIYFLDAPLVFSSNDSGSATTSIVYQNYPCETPVISGGKRITGWSNNGGVWTVMLSSASYQNFEGLFYKGVRRYRPRTTIDGFLYNVGPVYLPTQSDNCSIEVNGQWECFDRFAFNAGDMASTYHAMALGDVEILDFEKWTMSRMRLQSVDTANHIAYLTGPTSQNADNRGFLPGHRYLIENVKEALGQPGQWYLDRCTDPPACTSSNGYWTLSYVAQTGEDPNADGVIVPQLSQLIVASGLQYVTFQGLTFSHDNWLPPAVGLGDNQGIPAVSAALSFTNSSHVTFDGCVISHTQGWGVEFVGDDKGTTTSDQVINSTLYDLGAGGIRIGEYPHTRDTETNIPQNNVVQNNLITAGGRVQPSGIGTAVWVGNSHHNTVTHNEISDFYNGAIGIGYDLGISNGVANAHDNVVSYNLLYNLGQGVTSDMAGIYFATSATTGNRALNNVIHDVVHNWKDADGYGGHGIYFDQGASNVVARNNLVYRTSNASIFNNVSDKVNDVYPMNNIIDNNILVMGGTRTLQRGSQAPSTFSFTHNIVYFDNGQVQGGNWSCYDVGGSGLPVPCYTRFFLDSNLYWSLGRKAPTFITTDPNTGTPTYYSLSQWQALGEDVHSLNVDPLFTAPGYPTDDYTLQSGSPADRIGFVPFDFTQAGRTSPPPVVPDPVPAAFPLQLMDYAEF